MHFSSNKLFIRKKITALVTEHQLPTHSKKKKAALKSKEEKLKVLEYLLTVTEGM